MAAVLDLKGKQVGDLKLSEQVFAKAGEDQGVGTMHAALVRQLANTRSGSANTKTRAEVRGGGAKPWRQKGTGRARAGSRRSPLWAGGGVTFGPKPRDFSSSMPAKMRQGAIRSALSVQAANIVVVNDFADHKEVKTKEAAKVLQALKISDKRILFVVEPENSDSKRFGLSIRNMNNVTVVRANNIGIKELLNCEAILTSQGAIEFITKWLTPGKKDKSVLKKTESKAKTEVKVKTESKTEAKVETKAPAKEVKAKAPVVEKTAEKSQEKPSALRSIATTSKSKNAEAPASKKKDSSAKPKKADDESESKGKGK